MEDKLGQAVEEAEKSLKRYVKAVDKLQAAVDYYLEVRARRDTGCYYSPFTKESQK